ncbi:MAG: murein hydrolase activator EnvC family protein [Eubacteriales bacterium]
MGKKVISFLVACVIFLLMLPAGIQASDLDDLKDALEENEQNQQETIKKIDASKASIDELEEEIAKLNKNIQSVESQIAEFNAKINATQKQLDKVEVELDKAVLEKNEQKQTLDERLRVMYMYSNTSYLEILFSAKDFADLISKVDTIKTIAEYDQEVFNKLEQLEQEINAKREEIEKEKSNLISLKGKTQAKKDNLDQIKVSRQSYKTELDRKVSKYQKELNQLEAESNSIKNDIVSLQTIDDNINEGIYKWPMPGYTYISSSYGWRTHPITHLPNFHTGIDLPTSGRRGVSALAAGYGEVIKSTYASGYGNYVILDLGIDSSGNRISAVYAHLNKRYVGVGDTVTPGTPVGEVGTTGSSTGIHLHFEIRINGEHTNPLKYVSR